MTHQMAALNKKLMLTVKGKNPTLGLMPHGEKRDLQISLINWWDTSEKYEILVKDLSKNRFENGIHVKDFCLTFKCFHTF